MAIEKKWLAIPATALTADGTSLGVVTVADASLFHVKQVVKLYSITIPLPTSKEFIVNRVIGPGTIEVGNIGQPIDSRADVSAFLVADSAQIFADYQSRPVISHDNFDRAKYAEEPAVAERVLSVDPFGDPYSPTNPMPIIFDGTIDIGQVEVAGSNGNILEPEADGSLNINVNGLASFDTEQFAIGLTPVQITPTLLAGRSSIGFKSLATATNAIYIGNSSSVTTLTGYPLFNRETLNLDLKAGETIYAVATAAAQVLCMIELGN